MSVAAKKETWTVEENTLAGYGDNGPNFTIIDHTGKVIALLSKRHRLLERGETSVYRNEKRIAHLIAAAPDLLSSITNLMNGIDTKLVRLETEADDTLANALRDIRAAIDKAEGRDRG